MTPEELDAALTRAYNEGRDAEWQNHAEKIRLGNWCPTASQLERAGILAVARYSAERQRDKPVSIDLTADVGRLSDGTPLWMDEA